MSGSDRNTVTASLTAGLTFRLDRPASVPGVVSPVPYVPPGRWDPDRLVRDWLRKRRRRPASKPPVDHLPPPQEAATAPQPTADGGWVWVVITPPADPWSGSAAGDVTVYDHQPQWNLAERHQTCFRKQIERGTAP